ncbi:MAG: hypothetical protein ACPG6V_11930 [Flavobacteriales bacterium]
MKKVLYLILIVFGLQTSQAQIKRYKPTSYKDSFLEWLEIGGGYYEGKIADKQFLGSKYSEIRGIAIDGRIKIKKRFFLHGNAGYSLPSYETDFLQPGYGKYLYLTRYKMHNINAGFGFYVIGHHKSRFAFAPIAPSLGYLRYSVKVNYFGSFANQKDGIASGSQIGLGNLSTMHLRIGKIQLYSSLYIFNSLKNANTGYAGSFALPGNTGFVPEYYTPEYFYYTLQVGVRLRL